MKLRRKSYLVGLAILITLLSMLVIAHPAKVSAAYTDKIWLDESDIDFSKESDDDIDVEVGFQFRFNDNYTTLVFYLFLVEESDDDLEDKKGTKKFTYGVYVNDTNGTSGKVSKTYTFTIDNAETNDLTKNEDVRVYTRAYNGTTITSSKLIKSAYVAMDWPYGAAAAAATTGLFGTTITYRDIALAGIVFFVTIIAVALFFGRKKVAKIIAD